MTEDIQVTGILPDEENRWNDLLFSAINGSYRQSIPFEYTQKLNGREIETFVFSKNGRDIAGVHYALKKSKKNLINVADVLSGFVFAHEPDEILLSFLVNHFYEWAKSNGASYARINPWMPLSHSGNQTQYSSLFTNEMSRFGFRPINKGKHTYWIDLLENDEKILSKMQPQVRNKIRKGERSGLVMEKYERIDSDLIKTFWSLYDSLGRIKGFHTISRERFDMEIVSMVNHNLANLFFTKFNDTIINVAIASNFGEASYYYGAINPDFKSLKDCPSPGPFSQWFMIQTMKSKKLKVYDLGFCPGPVPQKEHPNYTVWKYKYDFGGDHIEFLPTYGKIIKPIRGGLFYFKRYGK